jgi:hypothetical protein
VCEEFSCLPSAALREWQQQPAGFLEEVIEARGYAVVKAMFDGADTPEAVKRLPPSDMLDLVKMITADLIHAARGRQTPQNES